MKIKEFGLRNFKSYGNNRQSISLNDGGSINLLIGRNGTGKTSLLQSLDFSCFRKVRGKNRKNISLSKIPNRINKNLVSDVTIESDGKLIRIVNGLQPDISEVYVDGVLDNKGDYSDYINMGYDTFKSLVSVKFTDFMDFMSLSSDEKKMLISKLCDLEYLNNISSKLPQIVKDNKEKLEKVDIKIGTLSKTHDTLSNTLAGISRDVTIITEDDLNTLKNEIINYKSSIESDTLLLKDYELKKDKLNKYLNSIESKKSSLITQHSGYKEKKKLHDSGKCAYCETNLTELHNHDNIITVIQNKMDTISSDISELNKTGSDKKDLYTKLTNKINILKNKINNDIKVANSKKVEYEVLKEKLQNNKERVKNINDLTEKISVIGNELKQLHIDRTEYIKISDVHKKMQLVLSNDGIKKEIIYKMVDPVNIYIREYIERLELPFNLIIDGDLNVSVSSYGYDVDSDTLSDGESRLLNLIIMLSYIKMSRKKINLNILFLDEVFIFIDYIYIEQVIDIVSEFSKEYNLNTFLVHHSPLLNVGKFDNIIYIKKNTFSEISYEH